MTKVNRKSSLSGSLNGEKGSSNASAGSASPTFILEVTPPALMKAIKNAAEIRGFEQCHIRYVVHIKLNSLLCIRPVENIFGQDAQTPQ